MTIEQAADDMIVSITYTLTVDGEVVDSADMQNPLEYLHGAENIVPGLETALTGKKVGDRVQVTLPPEEAFGDYDPDEVDEVGRDILEGAEDLQPGMLIEVEDEDGDYYLATVREITETSVIIDFNPPLAGKTLIYDAEIIALRPANTDELEHGHVHSALGPDDDEYDDDEEFDDYEDDDDEDFDDYDEDEDDLDDDLDDDDQ